MVQFDPDQDHLFSSDQDPAVWSRPWSGGGFTPVILVKGPNSCERGFRQYYLLPSWSFLKTYETLLALGSSPEQFVQVGTSIYSNVLMM